jgi:hypothetical protein
LQGEKFADTKKRLQARIGVSDKDLAKYRFALIQVVTFKQPSYIEDGDFVSSHCMRISTDDCGQTIQFTIINSPQKMFLAWIMSTSQGRRGQGLERKPLSSEVEHACTPLH